MELVYQYIAFFTFSLTSNHLHPLQVENYDSNSRLVVGEDDTGKFRLERVNDGCQNVVHNVVTVNVNAFEPIAYSPLLLDHWLR